MFPWTYSDLCKPKGWPTSKWAHWVHCVAEKYFTYFIMSWSPACPQHRVEPATHYGLAKNRIALIFSCINASSELWKLMKYIRVSRGLHFKKVAFIPDIFQCSNENMLKDTNILGNVYTCIQVSEEGQFNIERISILNWLSFNCVAN